MQVKHEIKGDRRAVQYDVSELDLEGISFQSNDVKCVDWPYKYPEYYKANETTHNHDFL
ncbi:unnamed protein product [Onchocerca flexuosa]|uniref:Uncharacterized protein n=1 Tax=Onchocerca flexuosa TaxID=387005 RepID=A0A183HC52_9BILA|nr:unnamed protein product [Onchocerca flexuosa]